MTERTCQVASLLPNCLDLIAYRHMHYCHDRCRDAVTRRQKLSFTVRATGYFFTLPSWQIGNQCKFKCKSKLSIATTRIFLNFNIRRMTAFVIK